MLRVSTLALWLFFHAIAGIADELEIDVPALPDIEITAPLTRVDVTGWDQSHIRISAVSLGKVKIEQENGRIHIDAGSPPLVWLSVEIPRARSLTVNGELADITIRSVEGDVAAFSTNNPIYINDIDGSVNAKTFLAPVHVDEVRGNVRAESNQAAVRLSSIEGDIWARTAGASVSLKNSISDQVELQTLNGTISLEGTAGPESDYLLASHRGVVEVRLSSDSNVTAELHGEPELFNAVGTLLNPVNSQESKAVIGDGRGKLVIQSPRGPISLIVRDRK